MKILYKTNNIDLVRKLSYKEDKEYFEIAERRIKSTNDTLRQSLFYGMDI